MIIGIDEMRSKSKYTSVGAMLGFITEWLKTKNIIITIMTIAVVITIVQIYSESIQDDDIFYRIMIFIVLISLYLVTLSKEIGNNHAQIIALIDDQKDCVPFATTVVDSQFEFRKMVCDATKSIFIIGPNLNFLAAEENEQEMEELLFQKLKNNPQSFKIRMLLADPKREEICKIMSKFCFTGKFQKQLHDVFEIFLCWKKEAGGLDPQMEYMKIRKTGMIAFSLLFIDEEGANARVLVTPIPANISGGLRPCFLITKKQHKSAFDIYYTSYNGLFNDKEKSEDIVPRDIGVTWQYIEKLCQERERRRRGKLCQ